MDYTFKSWAKNRPCFPLSCSRQVFDHRQQRQKLLIQYLYWSDLWLVHSTIRRWIQSSLNYLYLKWGMWFLMNKLNWRFWSRKAKTQAKKIPILLDFSSLSSILLLATTLQSTNALQSKAKFPSELKFKESKPLSKFWSVHCWSVIWNSSNWNWAIIQSKNIKSLIHHLLKFGVKIGREDGLHQENLCNFPESWMQGLSSHMLLFRYCMVILPGAGNLPHKLPYFLQNRFESLLPTRNILSCVERTTEPCLSSKIYQSYGSQ